MRPPEGSLVGERARVDGGLEGEPWTAAQVGQAEFFRGVPFSVYNRLFGYIDKKCLLRTVANKSFSFGTTHSVLT